MNRLKNMTDRIAVRLSIVDFMFPNHSMAVNVTFRSLHVICLILIVVKTGHIEVLCKLSIEHILDD